MALTTVPRRAGIVAEPSGDRRVIRAPECPGSTVDPVPPLDHGDAAMTRIVYEVVEHDEGWAYKVGDVYSETFATHDEALAAAQNAASEQELEGNTETIEYQDPAGNWREEVASGSDRPIAAVEDEEDEP